MGFLQVLLWILKIIGILFVSVIALLLVSVLLVLFVPVRYRAQGHKAEDYGIEARISWLLHIFRVRVRYASETKLSYEVHLLWFLFLSNEETWKAEHEAKKQKKAEKKARKAEKKKQKQKEKRVREKAKQKKKSGAAVVRKQVGTPEKPHIERKADSTSAPVSTVENPYEEPQKNSTETEKKHWFARIREKISGILQKLKQKIQSILDTVRGLWQKVDTVVAFLKEETNKAAFGASWTTLVQILKHIGPTKIKGYLVFGMDDPATTGYILAVLGIFYGKFGKSFSIRPNFEEKQFETELWVKGRVRMSRLLYLAWKLWKNKDFKALLDNTKQLKSGIKTNGG